jgi:hypothetical protein
VQPNSSNAFPQPNFVPPSFAQQPFPNDSGFGFQNSNNPNFQPLGQGGFRQHEAQQQYRRKQPEDRPKKKKAILNCAPWILVYTKFRRRFVYNSESGESFWKFPPDVMKAVIEMDRVEWEKKHKTPQEVGESRADVQEAPVAVEKAASPAEQVPERAHSYDSDEYEEVEVTDDENEEGSHKRLKVEDDQPKGPVEFNEDDIAYQLAQMGQEEEYDQDWQAEYEEEPPLSEEDARALFYDLLDDHHINPYTPWDTIIEEGKIVDDERYTCLPNMKSRKEAWESWCRDRIQKLREQRAREEKKDPKIPYMAFLQKYATPKLYWPEFRRKYGKEPELRDNKLKDKDREKWYRDYISRLKLSETKLKEDLTALLKTLPLSVMNRSTSLSALPATLLTDLRYVSLRSKIRDPLIETYIALQPPAPEAEDVSPEEEAEAARQRKDRERREKALADREQRVEEERRKARGRLQYSRGMLREEEEELERAMKVGKTGLLGHYEGDKDMQEADGP